MGSRSERADGRNRLAEAAERHLARPRRRQGDPLGQDRRLAGDARYPAAAGAGAARPDRRRTVDRAVRQDHAGRHGDRAAGRLRPRPRRSAARQPHPDRLHRQRDRYAAQADDRARRRSGGAAAAAERDDRSERHRAGHRLLRRHGLRRDPAQHGARRDQHGVFQSGGEYPAGGRRRRARPGRRRCGFRHHDGVDAHRRQRRASVLRRRQRSLYRRDHRFRHAEHRIFRPHPGQRRAPRQSLPAGGLPDRAADAGGRSDPPGLHLRSPHQRGAAILARGRNRHAGGAVQRLAARLHAPDDQPAGR